MLLVCLWMAWATSAIALHTTGDLSVCLLTFTHPIKDGASLAPHLRRLLEEGLTAGPAPTLGEFLLSKGATWSILDTPTTLQLGLFLPLPATEAAEVAAVFCQHLVIRFQTMTWPTPSPSWRDHLKDFCLRRWPPRRPPPFLSVWVNPPLTPHRDRLVGILKAITWPNGADPDPNPALPSCELVCPETPPRVTHLAAWEHPSLETIVAARFLGERFIRLPGSQGQHSYEVWTFPQAVVLALSGNAPLDHLWERDAFTTKFLTLTDDPASSPAWNGFADHCARVHRAERGELEKGAFLESWIQHLGLGDQGADRPTFRRPDHQERVICLPRPILHRIVARLDSRPRYAALRSPSPSPPEGGASRQPAKGTSAPTDPTQEIDVVVAIRGPASVLETLDRSLDQAPVPELAGSTFQPGPEGVWLWRWTVPRAGLTYALSAARSLVGAALGLPPPSAADPLAPRREEFPGLDLALVAASPLPPYELFGLLQQGWPNAVHPSDHAQGATQGSATTGSPTEVVRATRALDLATLRTVLGLPDASPAALHGRWTLQTATGSGLARIVATLLLLNISPDRIESVDSLF